MMTVTMQRTAINMEVLDEAIRQSVGSAGITWDGEEVTVYLADDATPAQVTQARRIVDQHDPSRLSTRQQAALERKERLETLRADNAEFIDESAYTDESETVQKLAHRVAWLEQEILALRQGG